MITTPSQCPWYNILLRISLNYSTHVARQSCNSDDIFKYLWYGNFSKSMYLYQFIYVHLYFCIYAMHIQCTRSAHASTHIANTSLTQCTRNAHAAHTQCTRNAHAMHTHCTYNAHTRAHAQTLHTRAPIYTYTITWLTPYNAGLLMHGLPVLRFWLCVVVRPGWFCLTIKRTEPHNQ